MSVSKDEMRAAIYKNWACHKNRTRVDFQMFQAVFALIEHGPEVSRGFVEKLRDHLMAIRIKEYYVPNPRKAIADEIAKELERNGVEVEK